MRMAAMAVKDESLHHATESLILPSPRKYYRANIDTSHWQLRSLVSSPEQDLVYFPSGTDIYSINTKTQQRDFVASLGFIPRCLVASKEWLCCGGENGKYSVVSLKHRALGSDLSSFLNADPDSRLPLELDPTRRTASYDNEYSTRPMSTLSSRLPTAEKIDVGTEIVNCITHWFPKDDSSEHVHNVPVAVVSNNDCTVAILDLATSKTIQTLTLPDLVNRAAISPDGELLVAICDDPFLYVHKRRQKVVDREWSESKAALVYEWVPAGRIQLEGQRQADKTQMRGSFALSFSKSGQYLAVATQYGVISIFETEGLTETQSLRVAFTTSRPNRQTGAVRAMQFCPGPYDLLAWTESSGRIGVADVRTMFGSRQLILINTSDVNVERVQISEGSGQRTGYRSARHDLGSTPDYLGLDAERRNLDAERQQLRNLTRGMLDRRRDEELAVLQAIRLERQRREALSGRATLAEAGSIRTGPWADPRRSGVTNSSERTRLQLTTTLPSALREFMNPERASTGTFQAFIDERNRDSARRAQLTSDTSGRRTTRPPPPPETSAERSTANNPLSLIEGLSLTSGHRPSLGPGTESPEPRLFEGNPQRAEAESLLSARLRGNLNDDEQGITTEFAHRLRQPWRPSMIDDGVIGMGIRSDNAMMEGSTRGNETMGICWSPDGRILYAATLEGIHEYHVNVKGRKMFPSLVLR